MDDKSCKDIASEIDDFKEILNRLSELSEMSDQLETVTYDEDIQAFKSRLKEPENIEAIEEDFSQLKEKVEEETKKRSEISDKIKELQQEGYHLDPFLEKIDRDVNELFEEYVALSDNINTLQDMGRSLDELDLKDVRF